MSVNNEKHNAKKTSLSHLAINHSKEITQNLWQKARQYSKIAKLQISRRLRGELYKEKHRLISLAIEKSPNIIFLLNNRTTYWAVYCEGMGILHLDPADLSELALMNLSSV